MSEQANSYDGACEERGIHAASPSEVGSGFEISVRHHTGRLKRHECRAPLLPRFALELIRPILIALFFVLPAIPGLAAEPLRALMIAGGCCHDYTNQTRILAEGISKRANVVWTIVHEGDEDGRNHKFALYAKPDWAKGYDVVLHDECTGYVTNVAWVEQIARAHLDGTPAVVLHCAIHSYRNAPTDQWRKVLGVSSYQHQPLRDFQVVLVRPEHPVVQRMPTGWLEAGDELYEIKKVWPDCIPLAESITPGKPEDRHAAIWVNTAGKARVFGTTMGHSNATVGQDQYLDLVARGLLWACDKLDDAGKPKAGFEGKR